MEMANYMFPVNLQTKNGDRDDQLNVISGNYNEKTGDGDEQLDVSHKS